MSKEPSTVFPPELRKAIADYDTEAVLATVAANPSLLQASISLNGYTSPLLRIVADKGSDAMTAGLVELAVQSGLPGTVTGSCLQAMVRNKLFRALETSLRAGADVKWLSPDGESLLAECKDYAIAELLLRHGAPVDAAHRSTLCRPLHTASYEARADLMRLYLAHGANANQPDDAEQGPVYWCIMGAEEVVDGKFTDEMRGIPDILRALDVLKQYGASFATRKGGNGKGLLHDAPDDAILVSYLIRQGAPLHERDEQGQTPLHTVTEMNRSQAAKAMLEAGASPVVKDDAGVCAIDIARDREALKRLFRDMEAAVKRNADARSESLPKHRPARRRRQAAP